MNLINAIMTREMIKRGRQALGDLEQKSKNAKTITEDLLMQIIRDNENTEYGKKYHFDQIHSIEDYKRLVPFSTYDDYAPYIERMTQNNENNLITSYPIVHYAVSSGSVGVPKSIPVSQETVEIYDKYSTARAQANVDRYYRKKYGRSVPRGKCLIINEVRMSRTENGISKGAISGKATEAYKKYMKHYVTSPLEVLFPEEMMDMKYMKIRYALMEPDLVFMVAAFMTAIVDLMNYMKDNWEMLCDDIESGKINSEILVSDELKAKLESRLKPDKKRADELRKIFKEGFNTPIIPKIWKKMTWVYAIGTGGFVNYTDKMRSFTGDKVIFDFSVYAASEALMAVAKEAEETTFALLPDACYFEFIPADSDDEETTYGIHELEVGKDYEVVLTNLSGFYRYKIKDVVRCDGYYNEIPTISFVYRKNQMVSIAGEKTNEECVRWAVNEFSKEIGLKIMDYAIYADINSEPGRYVMLIEPDVMVDVKDIPKYRDILEEKMGIGNPSYGSKVKAGVLSPMCLHLSQLQTHAAYRDLMIMKGASENQLKQVRVLDTPRKEKFFLTMIEDEEV